ncbi:MAG TPA: adenine deaminase C-terminal domain-containing protein [Acidimicrobiales bacterium]|nr:adenine deaminase C-terminal domain-containing protein [Acidimicrobiales bacterium]
MIRDEVDTAVRQRVVAAARGRAPFDLLLAGGTVVDVGTAELRPADVGIVGPLIASVHPAGTHSDTAALVDCSGRFVAPGLIDMHVHFESSMLTPGQYAAAVCPRGTTTVFCDPHELANVAGVAGVRYAVDASRGLPVRFIVQAPSCVPPQPGLELSGHDLLGPDVAEMLSWPEVGGLAEVMDMLGVLTSDSRMSGVVAAGLASGKLVSGHAAGLAGAELQAYLSAGIDSDHEIFLDGDVLARLRAGLTVELRGMIDGLLPKVVAELEALDELPVHLVACTDDLFAMTLLDDGGVDHLLRRLVAYGMSPVRALRIATYHAAYRLHRSDLGLVAAGRQADLIVLDDLASLRVGDVYTSGVHVAQRGEMVVGCDEGPAEAPLHTVHVEPLTAEDFVLRLDQPPGAPPTGRVRVRVVDGMVYTHWSEVELDVEQGTALLPPGHLLQAVVHRHGRIAARPRLGVIAGWGEDNWTGAIATTVSHDTHNLVVFGRDPVAMATAANAVIAAEGGVAVARATEVVARIELPIAGLLSPLSAGEVAEAQRRTQAAAREVGLPAGSLTQPLLNCLVSSLACIPGPHVTDLGLVDGTTGEVVPDLVLS